MTNEEKASEIVIKIQNSSSLDYDGRRANYMYDAAMEMAEWKDKERKEQKQQIIDKAADFISKHFYIGIYNHVISKEDYYTITELIRDFEQTVKGE